MLIETHAHLTFDRFDEDREAVIERAFEKGVGKIINVATDVESSKRCIELAEGQDGLFATVGIHPNDSEKLNAAALAKLHELSHHPKVVAIGEIGMDFYRDTCPPAAQEGAFREQIRFAKESGLPIVIHNREAGAQIVAVLRSEGTTDLAGGVFHCFSGDRQMAEAVLELGFHISFTGNLTFKKSELPRVARAVPLERLLLETDCPFLSPEPKRGRRNEPANVVYIAEKLAGIKGMAFSEIATATTRNANRLFGLGEKDME